MDSNDVRYGIKQVESDKIVYNFMIFVCMCIGTFIGFSVKSFWAGLIITLVLGTICARFYFNAGRKKQ